MNFLKILLDLFMKFTTVLQSSTIITKSGTNLKRNIKAKKKYSKDPRYCLCP